MLKKLLKYDLKSIFKFLIIFYGLSLFFAILTRIFLSVDNSFIMNIIGKICSGITISMLFNILINNLMRLWVRFKGNLYGDESYLTHTLPIERKTIYLSKVITAIITMFTSVIVIALTIFVAYYSKENLKMLTDMLLPIANAYGSTIVTMLLAILFVFFLEIANAVQAGFTGIILGYRMNNAKTGYSILFGFITYMITQLFALLSIFIVGLFNADIMNLFFTNQLLNIEILKFMMYLAIIVYTIILFVLCFINSEIFKKGVNVD